MAGILLLLVILALIVSIPGVQTYLGQRLTGYVRQKTGAVIQIDRVKITRSGKVELSRLLARDSRNDTLIYIGSFRSDIVDFGKILKGKTLLNATTLSGLKVNMRTYKGDSIDELNRFIALLDKGNDSKSSHFLLKSDLVKVSDASFTLTDFNKAPVPTVAYYGINGTVTHFAIKGSDVYGKIRGLSLTNEKGIRIEEMQTDFTYTNSYMHFLHTSVATARSSVRGDIIMEYEKKDLKHFVDKVKLDIRIDEADLALYDLQKYYSPLGNDDLYHFQCHATGTLNRLTIEDISLTTGTGGVFKGKVELTGIIPREGKEPVISAQYNTLITAYPQLHALLPETFHRGNKDFFESLGKLASRGSIRIAGEKIHTTAHTSTGLGNWQYDLNLDSIRHIDQLSYRGTVSVVHFPLGKVTRDTSFGNISLKADISGTGIDPKRMNARIDSRSHEFEFRGYSYTGLSAKGNFSNGRFSGTISADDPDVKFKFKGIANLSGEKYLYRFHTRIDKLDLNKLQLQHRDSTAVLSGDISIDMQGNRLEELEGKALIDNAVFTSGGQSHSFGKIFITSHSGDSLQHLNISAKGLLRAKISGHYDFEDLGKLAQNAFGSIYTHYKPAAIKPHQHLEYDIRLEKQFFDILYPGIHLPGHIKLKGKIDSDNAVFKLNLKTKELAYKDMTWHKLKLQIDNQNPLFNTQLNIDSISSKTYSLQNIYLINKTLNDTLHFRAECTGGAGKHDSYNLSFYHTIDSTGNSILGFHKSKIDIGSSTWWLNPGDDTQNKIVYSPATGQLEYRDFSLYSKDKGGLFIQGMQSGKDNLSLNVDLDRIYLQNIIPGMKGFDFKGMLNGGIWIEKKKGQLIPTADIQVLDLYINDELQGDLIGEIRGAGSYRDYNVDVYIEKNDFKTFYTQGNVHIVKDVPSLDLSIAFNHYELGLFNRLGKGVMEKIRGEVSGKLKLKGKLENPDFSGILHAYDTGVYFPYLNVDYSLENGTPIFLDKRSFKFHDARILDSYLGTSGSLNGSITHYFFKKWYLDIEIETDNLLAINTREGENELFYGTGYLKGTARIQGNTDNINISIAGSSMPGSEIIIPMTDIKTVETSRLIHYKPAPGSQDEDNRISHTAERFKGLTLDFNLDLTKDATIEFILDPVTGSTLRGNGTGNIQMYIDTKGIFNMYGEYVVDKGFYIFKYGFFSKYFDVKKGGTIVFSGDPYKAILDIEAIYKTKANPGVLLADYQTNRKIDLELHTKITGELFHSIQKFDITAPNAPIDISSELDFVLNEQNTGNMMIQFLSLLMTDRFIDSNNLLNTGLANASSGSIDSFSATVSNALVGILSNPDDPVNFGFQYTQGEISPDKLYRQSQLELSAAAHFGKNNNIRFNGEMYVPTGNRTNANIAGVASIELPINKKENLMLKIFQRKTDYQFTDEEQGYTRGVGISWQVNFNKYRELISPQGDLNNKN